MSIPTDDRASVPHPVLGDLRLWYSAFEAYAAMAAPGDGHFHGPHVAVPVELDRVLEGLKWLDEEQDGSLGALPTLDQLRELIATGTVVDGGIGPAHSGSACHNLWHWIHGS